ncbi:MAG: SDR family NAD(P)-dependent oxidoreductase [Myxococcota bacterium]|jgi:NAD(P)-dependent dehydrogenase (short-subunit alcohol dehydrogenase family)
MSLQGRIAWVTGGASGMGRAIALALAKAGADVAIGSLLSKRGDGVKGELSYLPGESELDEVRSLLEAEGVRAHAANLDVTSDESVEAFHASATQALGPIDILANAAGITAEQTVIGHSFDLWQKVIDVNLNGVFRTTHRCLPGMIDRGWGRVINIASTAASVGATTSGAYCASKAGVVAFSRCVALEGAEHGVTCNAISPTWVETKFGSSWMTNIAEVQEARAGEEYIADAREANPQKRLIQPDEIGALAAFLCSEGARGITMQDLTVSGGSLW